MTRAKVLAAIQLYCKSNTSRQRSDLYDYLNQALGLNLDVGIKGVGVKLIETSNKNVNLTASCVAIFRFVMFSGSVAPFEKLVVFRAAIGR